MKLVWIQCIQGVLILYVAFIYALCVVFDDMPQKWQDFLERKVF